jgi:hypothetical protein
MFLDFNSTIIAFTSSRLLKLSGFNFASVRDFEGEFYDARIMDNSLYFVEKTVKRKETFYTLYKTTDLVNFQIIEKSDYRQ